MPDMKDVLHSGGIEVSAPCRIDIGGTLDISTFYLPLRQFNPCTFNIAIDLKTRVRLLPHDPGKVKMTSKGFDSAEFNADEMPFTHPMGLMFSIASYFGASGVHIDIESTSPPRSALGGSSSAGVALVAAFFHALQKNSENKRIKKSDIVVLAHALEAGVAGVPCGFQDQLAAAYGGVNAWYWHGELKSIPYHKKTVVKKSGYADLEQSLLVAYCGYPHESKQINRIWCNQFLSGAFRKHWQAIIRCTHAFIEAIEQGNYHSAGEWMNRETTIRKELTPDVLDNLGDRLWATAIDHHCGARFTGAGGGGCMWAIGESESIRHLKPLWKEILSQRDGACLLNSTINHGGIEIKRVDYSVEKQVEKVGKYNHAMS